VTFKWYKLFHKAWTQNPPADWLMAAQLGYKSPDTKRKEAVANTRRMFDVLQGFEAAAKRTKKDTLH
jgi:hypothetical protein